MSAPNPIDNPFVILTFLAAPAILTNACTVLALGTSNRLARAADRARALSTVIVAAKNPADADVRLRVQEFMIVARRAELLVLGLRRFYLAAGCFAAGTCIALIGAFLSYLGIRAFEVASQIGTVLVAMAGVGGLVHGSFTLLFETQLALRSLEQQHTAIRTWQSTHALSDSSPAGM